MLHAGELQSILSRAVNINNYCITYAAQGRNTYCPLKARSHNKENTKKINDRKDNDLPQGFDQEIKKEDNKDDVTKCHSAGDHGRDDSLDEEPNFNLFGSQPGNVDMAYIIQAILHRLGRKQPGNSPGM